MFSQTAEYAMRAMSWLAITPDELVPTSELSKQTKVPPPYLAKVLQNLAGAELIKGRRGVGGGYKLARPASTITLLDVVNAVTNVTRIHRCPLGLENHGTNLCPLHRKADAAAAAVIEVLGGVTLDQLLTEPGSSKPLCDAEVTARLTVSAPAAGRPT